MKRYAGSYCSCCDNEYLGYHKSRVISTQADRESLSLFSNCRKGYFSPIKGTETNYFKGGRGLAQMLSILSSLY